MKYEDNKGQIHDTEHSAKVANTGYAAASFATVLIAVLLAIIPVVCTFYVSYQAYKLLKKRSVIGWNVWDKVLFVLYPIFAWAIYILVYVFLVSVVGFNVGFIDFSIVIRIIIGLAVLTYPTLYFILKITPVQKKASETRQWKYVGLVYLYCIVYIAVIGGVSGTLYWLGFIGTPG